MNRKQYSPEMKMQIVKETLETGNASIVARRHDIAPSLVARWARCYKRYGTFYPQKEVPGTNGSCIPPDYKKITKENEQLKKLLGEKDLEIAILRDLLKKTNLPFPIK
ncbi:transposase [Thermacetogenium phaeum DSM 12270]|uniref:Transposase n=1 Tax=Thermacetogenium phaeum (strain ATCC BAA-254 / DSM 26808 / PB) TaxID=1089553 RepID=K4LXA0_THEPS|nr:transposase [Thermacetogenium phaeum]AFV12604.1 transposase [Thermacetogenium phaeum DSM 12270]